MIRARGKDRYEVRVYAGRNPVTGKEQHVSRTVRGGKRKARERERALIAEVKAGRRPASQTVGTLLRYWMEAAPLERSTRYQAAHMVDKLEARIGNLRLDKLTPARLDGLYADLLARGSRSGGPLAPGTVRRYHGLLRSAFAYAISCDWIDANPALRAHPPRLPRQRPVVPELAAVQKLLADESDPVLAVFLRLLVATGMRRGEVCALRWTHVDLKRGSLRKIGALGEAGAGPYEKGTKTGAEGQITLDAGTCDVLGAHREAQEATAAALDCALVRDAFLFSHEPDGSAPIGPGVFTARFCRLRDRLGLDVQMRNLRHFHATQLLDAGVSLATVSQRLSHSSSATTTQFYAGWLEASDQEAAEKIARVFDR